MLASANPIIGLIEIDAPGSSGFESSQDFAENAAEAYSLDELLSWLTSSLPVEHPLETRGCSPVLKRRANLVGLLQPVLDADLAKLSAELASAVDQFRRRVTLA